MRSSWSILASLALFFVLAISSSSFTSAQSPNCHACIKRIVPTVANCTTLTPAQLNTVDLAIHGHKFGEESSTFKTTEPAAFECLTALMWDSVHYKASLWSKCLDPASSCPWAEMMQYMTIIPRMAAVYGAKNPPLNKLKRDMTGGA
ncbi:hypothetical protein BGZ93_007891 [Podila epicladia]|nr:hypothetical protein BGZ92_009075 [Podila epicladia]KAG0099395.1 hypothetical protein BGZ93_007891 [Podila epicladia]